MNGNRYSRMQQYPFCRFSRHEELKNPSDFNNAVVVTQAASAVVRDHEELACISDLDRSMVSDDSWVTVEIEGYRSFSS
jgi:hypothetical protein